MENKETGKPFLAFPYSKQVRAIQYLPDRSNSTEVMKFISESGFSPEMEPNGDIRPYASYPIIPSDFVVIEKTRTQKECKSLTESEFQETYEFGTSIII